MTRLKAIARGRGLEERVTHLFLLACKSIGGIVALKLLYSDIKLPEEGSNQYYGKLCMAIAVVIVGGPPNTEWTVWSDENDNNNIKFKMRCFMGWGMPNVKHVPDYDFNGRHEFTCTYPASLPF